MLKKDEREENRCGEYINYMYKCLFTEMNQLGQESDGSVQHFNLFEQTPLGESQVDKFG